LVLSSDDIVELVLVFMPERNNHAHLVDRIETHIIRVGRSRLPAQSAGNSFAGRANREVRRILEAFVDMQWLAELDARPAVCANWLHDDAAGAKQDE